MQKPKKKLLLFLAVGLVIAGGAAAAGYQLLFTEAEATALTGTTSWGSLAKTIEGTGITMPAESYTYSTASDTEITQVLVSAGDTVHKGDLLYVQDDSEVDEAIDDYRDQIEDYQDQIASYEDQIADLQEEMAEVSVKAPLSGRVLDVQVEAGDEVKKGDTLCTVVSDGEMKLTEYFSYAYEDLIYEGMPAVVSSPDLMQNWDGTVTELKKVERITAEGTRCFAVTITLENPGALSEGMSAGAYLKSGAGKLYPAVEGTLENLGEKTVTAKCSGEVLSVSAVDYAKVEAGDLLLQVDESDYLDQISDLRDQITRAQDRIATLTERIAEEEESRADYAVTSDIDGKVIMVRVREGETPSKGTTAVMVYDLSTMSITASIDELDIDYITEGMTARIVRSGAESDTEYTGTVTEVGLEASSSGGVATFSVEITIDSEGALSAGVNVSYYIEVGDGDVSEGVLAPVAAVQSTDEGTCLFVQADVPPENAVELEEGVVPDGFYAVPVEVGTSSGMQVRILSGAEEDMTVFLGYRQKAPSGGDTTSQGDGTGAQQSGFPGGDFSGGMPSGMPGGGNFSGGGMGGGMRPG